MKTYEIHSSAGLVPMAVDTEQDALTLSIKEYGQKEPATLYRGKIVDGRCRYKSCNELGIELKVVSLPNNMSLDDVAAYVRAANTRRNLTRSQKVIIAYRNMLKTKLSMRETAARWAVTPSEISNAKYISANRPDYAQRLFDGGNIQVGFDKDKNKPIYSYSIAKVRKYIEKEVKAPDGSAGYANDELDEIKHLKNVIRLLEQENDEYRESNTEILLEDENLKSELDHKKQWLERLAKKHVPEWTAGDK